MLSHRSNGQFLSREGGEKFDGMSVTTNRKGYKTIKIASRTIQVHVLVWERANGKRPYGLQIHHIDHDKGNNSLNNLELVSQTDHQRIHAGWIREDGVWTHKPCNGCNQILALENFYVDEGSPRGRCKSCRDKESKEWTKGNPDKRKKSALDYYYRNRERILKQYADRKASL